MALVRNRVLRTLLFVTGALSLFLGLLGAFLPVLPTTPFVLLSAWCFLKSSPKAHDWIYRQPLLGEALKNWEETRSISRRTKMVAIPMILVSCILLWVQVQILWLKIAVTLLLTGVSLFILSR